MHNGVFRRLLPCAGRARLLRSPPPASAGSLAVTALQRDGKPLVGAVVLTRSGIARAAARSHRSHAIMDQVNLAFVPDVLVLPVHSSVQFPEQRRRQPPGVFVFERAPVPAAAVSRQALSTRDVRRSRASSRSAATSTTTCSPTSSSPRRRSSAAPAPTADGPQRHLPAGPIPVRLWHPLLNEPRKSKAVVQVGEPRATASTCKLTHATCSPPHSPAARTHGTTEPSASRLASLACAGARIRATRRDWELALDLRAVSSDGRESFLDNGQGKLRFDEDHQGIQLGRLRAAWNQPLGEVFCGARRSLDLGRRRQESDRPHRGLSRIPAVSARRLQERACGSARSIHPCRSRVARSAGKHRTRSRLRPSALDRRGDPHRSASRARSTG